jgi:hypothetical protein
MLRRHRGQKSGTTSGKNRKEYWKSRFAPGGEEPGRITKDLTHRKDRRQAKKLAYDAQQGA